MGRVGIGISEIAELIREASSDGIATDCPALTGFSGEKIIGTLQRLAACNVADDDCYLEVGVFQGLTLLSVAAALGDKPAFGVDNFAQFDPKSENLAVVHDRIRRMNIQNASIINMDFEKAFEELMDHIGDRKVSVYFVDGPHDYRSQLMCLELIKPYLSESAIIIVDDSNYLHVRQANSDFLRLNSEFKLIFQAYTKCHPANMSSDDLHKARSGWWNGVNVIVKDPENELQAEFPPTTRDRSVFVNDHIVHASSLAVCSDRAIRVVSSLFRFRLIRAFGHLWKLVFELRRKPVSLKGEFESANTYSESLPNSVFNSTIS